MGTDRRKTASLDDTVNGELYAVEDSSAFTPARLLWVILLSICALEAGVMILLRLLPPLSPEMDILVDAVALAILGVPVMYFFLYRPMALTIAKRKNVEKALRKSQERYKHLVDSISDIIWEVDPQFNLVALMSKGGSFFGYGREEMIGEPIWRFMSKNAVEEARDTLERLAAELSPIKDYELWIVKKNGNMVCLMVNAVPIFDDEGVFAGYRGISRDITDRKRAEEALRVSETKYRIVADNNYDWEFWLSPQDRFMYSSPSCERITGYTVEEFEKNPNLLARIIHPDDQQVFAGHMSKPIEERGVENLEFRIIHRNGDTRVIAHYCRPIYDSQRQFLGVRGSNRDVTRRRKAEDERKESERRFREIIENVRLATVILDLSGNIFYCNDFLLELTGHDRHQIIGRDIFGKFVKPERRDDLRKFLLGEVESGVAPNNYTEAMLSSGGEEIIISWSNTVLRDAQGKVVGLTCIGEDITGRVRVEEALRRAHDELEIRVRERTAELSALIEQSPVAISVLDMDGRIVQVNRAWEKLFDRSLEEIQGGGYNIFEDTALELNSLVPGIRRVFEKGGVFTTEPVLIGTGGAGVEGGRDKWVIMRLSGVVGENGEVNRVINMIEDITERRSAEDALRLVVEGTASSTGEDFFRSLVRNLASALNVSHVYVTEKMKTDGMARTIAFWMNDQYLDNFEFNLKGTPCEQVFEQGKTCFYPDRIHTLFPKDKELGQMGLKSYLGTPLLNSSGEVIGHIGALDGKPMKDMARMEPILRVFAARAAAELERKMAQDKLEKSHETTMKVLGGLDAGVYVADMETYEILFLNQYMVDIFGDAVGKTCWKALQEGMEGPCPFCTNKKLLTDEGAPAGVYVWEFQNTRNGRWYEIHDRAIQWIDGRIVRLEVAMDITERKRLAEALEQVRPVSESTIR